MLTWLLACAPSTPATSPTATDDGDYTTPIHIDTGDAEVSVEDSEPIDTGTPPEDTGDAPPSTLYEACFQDFMSADYPLADYDAAGATIAEHCLGTDHQKIEGVERVVFVGDSVTLGSPPADSKDWYRNRLADQLADAYGLEKPGWLWQNVDIFSGKPLENQDGDFGVCAWWGARTDDLLLSNQLPDCLPESEREKTTLIVITSGGNDVFKQVQSKGDGATDAELEAAFDEWVVLMRDALEWIKEPGRFPNGVFVVFANVYEYADGTGDLGSCPGAGAIGMGDIDTTHVDELTRQAMGAYLQMAVDTQTDMLFLRESFCGHGYAAAPGGPCYRGEDAALWFDETCIHPNAAGHAAIADAMWTVISD